MSTNKKSLLSRFKSAWNLFRNKDEMNLDNFDYSVSTSYRNPSRSRVLSSIDRSFITALYSRMSIDVATSRIEHVRLDQNGNYKSTINSDLNYALTMDANVDQTGRALIQDIALTMFSEGCVAIVPTDTTRDPTNSDAFDIQKLRTGLIKEWKPDSVYVNLYNERTGRRDDIWLPKNIVAIVENPFYSIMNEPNGTLQRLIRKLMLLDSIDENKGSNRLDMIIQLPYSLQSEAQRSRANKRKEDIESQLNDSPLGIAYIDATEKITQLNRPVENTLLDQIKYYMETLYNQLGITASVFDGTADEQTMTNYYDRTIEPILSSIVDEMNRKWISKTARTQGQAIMFYRDPFKLIPTSQIAETVDKLTRNAVLSSNEVRGILGYKPSDDPRADALENKNLNPVNTNNGNGVNIQNEREV